MGVCQYRIVIDSEGRIRVEKSEAGYVLLDVLIGVLASLMVVMLGCVVLQSRML